MAALLSGTFSVALGQAILVVLAPLSRAESPGVTRSGIALLSADSVGYLSLASSPDRLNETTWTLLVVVHALSLVAAASLVHVIPVRVVSRSLLSPQMGQSGRGPELRDRPVASSRVARAGWHPG